MPILFIPIRALDIIDILIVAYLLYQVYRLIKGTAAINIFVGIFSVYLLWLIVRALNMQLLGSILGQIIGVGVIALIVLFQQEIRRFLLMIGSRYMNQRSRFSLDNLLKISMQAPPAVRIKSIARACERLSESRTGALIVIARKSSLEVYAETGDAIEGRTSSRLLEAIFLKGSPLHDGAVIITDDKVHAARCILPVSENPNIPADYGMRHRAGIGITEHTDAFVVIVSEETGGISVAESGILTHDVNPEKLMQILEREFYNTRLNS
jgi:diadenylate cyclase